MTNPNPALVRIAAHGLVAAAVYQELRELLDASTHEPTSAALRDLLLAILCGLDWKVGDYAHEVARVLGTVPSHASVDDARARLITMLAVGAFAESPDERTKRRASRLAAAHAVSVAQLVNLPERSWLVHTWLYRHVEVYGTGPTGAELAEGLGMKRLQVEQCLLILERHGAAVNFGGPREWLPTRHP